MLHKIFALLFYQISCRGSYTGKKVFEKLTFLLTASLTASIFCLVSKEKREIVRRVLRHEGEFWIPQG